MPESLSPFRPGFGGNPPRLVGRDALIDAFVERLEPDSWRSERVLLVRGLRGSGKTALLNAFEDAARGRGWVVVSETAEPGMLRRLEAERLPLALRELDPGASGRRVTGGGIAGVGTVQTESVDAYPVAPTVRGAFERLTDLAETGVLITVDELHKAALDDLRPVLTAVQHAVREDRSVLLVGAGLPNGVDEVLADPGTSFLRRSLTFSLGPLSYEASRAGLETPVVDAGRSFDERALQLAIAVAQGQPYLVQLIGDRAWRVHPGAHEITLDDVRAAAPSAIGQFGDAVLSITLRDVSPADRAYLEAMLLDADESPTGEIAERLGKSANAAGNSRARLIDKGLVADRGYGRVAFAVPYLREYLAARRLPPAEAGGSAYPSPAEVLRQLASPPAGGDTGTGSGAGEAHGRRPPAD